MKRIYIYMIIVATLIYCCQRLEIELHSLVNNYVNDLLCIPIILSISQMLVRKAKRDAKYILKKRIIIFIVIYYSIYFEYYLPQVTFRYTADFIDVILYCLGGFIFFFFENYGSEINHFLFQIFRRRQKLSKTTFSWRNQS